MAIEKPLVKGNTRGLEGAKARGQQAFVLDQCALPRFVPDHVFVWFMKVKELSEEVGEASYECYGD